jgi:hypothetical protein
MALLPFLRSDSSHWNAATYPWTPPASPRDAAHGVKLAVGLVFQNQCGKGAVLDLGSTFLFLFCFLGDDALAVT